MRKVKVRDAQGARWTVRTRRLRSTEVARPMSTPEQESLRRRLTRALAPHPGLAVDGIRGVPDAWRMPDSSDIELREARRAFGDAAEGAGVGPGGLVAAFQLVAEVVDHLRTPMTDTWQLDALAGGRIRRWARWQVHGLEAADRTAAAVAGDLASGRVPQPDDAMLIDVVDQRPATAPRRSAGLGRTRASG